MTLQELRNLIADLSQKDLRTLRSIINGKLSRRTITEEQQKKMQDGRKVGGQHVANLKEKRKPAK